MAQTLEQRQKATVVRQIREYIISDTWGWRGTEFIKFKYCGLKGAEAYTCFTAKFNCLKVDIDMEREYNLPNQVCMFAGENAMGEAIDWAAERLIELYKTVSARIAPYVDGYLNYIKAIKGQ